MKGSLSLKISGFRFFIFQITWLLILRTYLRNFGLGELLIWNFPPVRQESWAHLTRAAWNGRLGRCWVMMAFIVGQICWNDFRVNLNAIALCATPAFRVSSLTWHNIETKQLSRWDTFPFVNIWGCGSGPNLACVPWHRSVLMADSNGLLYCYPCSVIRITW